MIKLTLLFIITAISSVKCNIQLSKNDITMEVDETILLKLDTPDPEMSFNRSNIQFAIQHKDVFDLVAMHLPRQDKLNLGTTTFILDVHALKPGKSEVAFNISANNIRAAEIFLKIKVLKSITIDTLSKAFGWAYFIAWSISFYPQLYSNYVRKSVVGLSFDFLALNLVGYIMYAIFNVGLYYIPKIKMEYAQRYPKSLSPVFPNDILFTLHGTLAVAITIWQCFIYKRQNQQVSLAAKALLVVYGLIITCCINLAGIHYMLWLDVLYVCSYIKLSVTVLKYMPQLYYNYQRKSTTGWCIGNVLIDIVGGFLSLAQMFLNGYNYADWGSIFENPTKFGLGLLTIAFDLMFITQHYILYKHRPDSKEAESMLVQTIKIKS